MKSDTIILLGDFNCDLLGIDSKTESEIHPKTRRLLTLFQLFDMQNIVNKPTRISSIGVGGTRAFLKNALIPPNSILLSILWLPIFDFVF